LSVLKSLVSFFFKKSQQNQEVISEELKEMSEDLLGLQKKTVQEVMVPRIDVIFINGNDSLENIIKIIIESGFSRFPVYNENIDNIIGIIHSKDILKVIAEQKIFAKEENAHIAFSLENLLRPAYFIPGSKKLDTLLKEFKKRHVHIAVSIDEYGGTSGIVSLEDIIEEIVGDIQDEFDDEEEEIVKINDRTYLCDARILIDDLNEELKINLQDKKVNTLGGFLFDLLDKIPQKGEKIYQDENLFIVQELEGHKIQKVKVILKESFSEN